VTFLQGDAKDDTFLGNCLKRLDRLDAIVDFMNYPTGEFAKRKDHLLESTHQYVFMSSARVYAPSDEPMSELSPRLLDVCEDQAYLATDEYALAKARSENLLTASPSRNWTIIRPYVTFGVHRLQLGTLEIPVWLWRATHSIPVALPEILMDRYTTMTWAGDVAGIVSQLVGCDAALGEVFNVVTNESQTWSEVCDLYQVAMDLKIHTVPTKRYANFMGSTAQLLLDRATHRRFDASKAIELIGGWQFSKLSDTLPLELVKTLCDDQGIEPDPFWNGAMDAVLGIHSSLASTPKNRRIAYWQGRYPVLKKALRSVESARRRSRTHPKA
jgi:hypothetical protein